ncbi:MAG: ribonuclease Z [Desulfuromonas sp.]|uniref:ribonuclease Z n=1 Tax=Desulfuromonas sp. TaxID=892 RepID=UPI000CB1E1AD|nr:MBL fold metallo-hydrolase [Desulfuromonas sp.]PLX85447.1 MAG: ribonuclease Z [Desulfuromonas sp.]
MRSVFYPRLVNGPFGDPALYVRLAYRGEAFLFDCGDLRPLSVREILKIGAVFVSHAHIDHLVGFDILLRLFLCREGRLLLYGPPGMVVRMAGRLSGYTWNLTADFSFELTVREWDGVSGGEEATFRAREGFRPEGRRPWDCPDGVLLETPYCRVRSAALDHGGIPSLAFALEEPLHVAVHRDALEAHRYLPGPWLTALKDLVRGGAPEETPVSVPLAGGGSETLSLGMVASRVTHAERGMKVSYVTDASPSSENQEKIVELARDSHLLAIEATFAHAELERARARNHLTAQLAGRLARRAGAARFLLFHHSPRYQDRPDLLEAEARAAFAGS